MGKVSKIEWTDSSWSPWYGCTKTSEGCRECYMFRWAKRTGRNPNKVVRAKDGTFQSPLRWKEPRMIFVCSLGDFFHADVRPIWRRHAWNIMRSADQHTYLLLTKRPENIEAMLPKDWWYNPWPHIWLGVSAENQARADERIPKLLEIPAKIHFVSIEPMLGPIELRQSWCDYLEGWYTDTGTDPYSGDPIPIQVQAPAMDWVITGGESGPNCRPCDLDWLRSIRDQCVEAGVSFFHKQMGGTKKIDGAWGGRELDGRTWDEIPNRGKNEKESA